MSVIAIVVALLLEQWRPLVERKTYHALLARWANWLEGTFNAGESRHGRIAWGVAAAPLALGSLVLHYVLLWAHPFLALALNVIALYVTLGFRQFSHSFTGIQLAVKADDLDLARELIGKWRGEAAGHRTKEEVVRLAVEEALAASHRHVFAVLFWFMVMPGPSGAILYRLAGFLARRWQGQGAFGAFAVRVHQWMEWPAVRLTAIVFAVVGDFEDAIYCWRTQAMTWADPRGAGRSVGHAARLSRWDGRAAYGTGAGGERGRLFPGQHGRLAVALARRLGVRPCGAQRRADLLGAPFVPAVPALGELRLLVLPAAAVPESGKLSEANTRFIAEGRRTLRTARCAGRSRGASRGLHRFPLPAGWRSPARAGGGSSGTGTRPGSG